MPTTNDDLKDHGIFRCVALPNVNVQIGHRVEQLRIECTNLLPAYIVRVPWLVVVTCCFAKSRNNAFEIVLIFKIDVLSHYP